MSVRILTGSALDVLRTLPSAAVQCVVTSPPYFGLRDYGVEGQLGLEPTPALFIEHLVAIFDEVKRVLRPDGLCFVNLGDSYSGSGKGATGHNGIGDQEQRQGFTGVSKRTTLAGATKNGIPELASLGSAGQVRGIPAKNLLLIPERFVIAMQEAGWIVRSRIAWCKTSAMPESVRDRPTSAWEHIWMFSKSTRYFWDGEAVKILAVQPVGVAKLTGSQAKTTAGGFTTNGTGNSTLGTNQGPSTANLRNFWLLGPSQFKEAHFATFPPEIPRRCILAGTSEKGACPACGAPWTRAVERSYRPANHGGTSLGVISGSKKQDQREMGIDNGSPGYRAKLTSEAQTTGWQPSCRCDDGPPRPCVVLDPFAGSGTTLMVADRLGRDAVGIELNGQYVEMARRRLAEDAGPMFEDVAVEQPAQVAMFEEEM